MDLAVFLSLLTLAGGTNIELFVEPTGTGHRGPGNGTSTTPFSSVVVAQAAVRKILASHREQGGGAAEAVTVTLLPGAYYNTSLEFGLPDSPAAGGSVTWRGAGAAAVVYGGLRIEGWTPHTREIWKAPLPAELVDVRGRAVFHTLVQGHRSGWLARAPDYGSGFLPCRGGNAGFTCPPGTLPDVFDCVNSSCSVFLRAGYSSDIRAVTSVDLAGHSVTMNATGTDGSRGSYVLRGALELLDTEGEWAVRHGMVYFWPYSARGVAVSPNDIVITAPARQRVLSFVGADRAEPVTGITVAGFAIVGASMPPFYTYACRGTGAGASGSGADCAADGGPDTPDETNTSPRASSHGMVYMENATGITVKDCRLKAGGIAGIWMQEANLNHTVTGCWVEDMAGFGLYANGIGVGDRRYASAEDADVSHGHTITNNVFVDGGRQIIYGSGVWLYQVGSTVIAHNLIARFPRDGVGFYGMLPFWTADPGGPVAPGMPPSNKNAASRMPWGKFVTWNGANGTWSTRDVLMNKNNYLGFNDISSCNRQGLDGGVIESWGSSVNNTWEANAVHDNEVVASGLSLLFADDFSPDIVMRRNILYSNLCLFGNCAVMMIKSVKVQVQDNVVADHNYSNVFEISAYRMPAARMAVQRNIIWNVSQSTSVTTAYSASCSDGFANGTSWGNATLRDLLATGDGTGSQRSRLAQYGFNNTQLDWPVVSAADSNYVDDLAWLRKPGCTSWDRNSVELQRRPFSPVGAAAPWHSRTHLDYAIDPNSVLVTKHGFKGSFDVREIGLTDQFTFDLADYKRRDAGGRLQAEDYDRTENLFTTQGLGIGTGVPGDFRNGVPPGSWARFDGVDFGDTATAVASRTLRVAVKATPLDDGVKIRFQLGSPDASGQLLSEVVLPATGAATSGAALPTTTLPVGYTVFTGSPFRGPAPSGVHTVFMVFETLPKPAPSPPDNRPHRYWRLTAAPADFNASFYNAKWDVCAIELRANSSGAGPNLAVDPANAIASTGAGGKAFNGLGDNCTQWDGRSGANSNYWTPSDGHPHDHQWVGYDFGPNSPVAVGSIRVKQFPNQYCAATPALQFADDLLGPWVTYLRMQCSSECPNNATGQQPAKGWVQSPGPGTVAPPIAPGGGNIAIGGIVDWFSFLFDT